MIILEVTWSGSHSFIISKATIASQALDSHFSVLSMYWLPLRKKTESIIMW